MLKAEEQSTELRLPCPFYVHAHQAASDSGRAARSASHLPSPPAPAAVPGRFEESAARLRSSAVCIDAARRDLGYAPLLTRDEGVAIHLEAYRTMVAG